jgi:hypothetical protein
MSAEVLLGPRGRTGSSPVFETTIIVSHSRKISENVWAAPRVRPVSSGEGAAQFFGGLDPLLNDDFYVGGGFLVGLSVGGAATRGAPPVLRVLIYHAPSAHPSTSLRAGALG